MSGADILVILRYSVYRDLPVLHQKQTRMVREGQECPSLTIRDRQECLLHLFKRKPVAAIAGTPREQLPKHNLTRSPGGTRYWSHSICDRCACDSRRACARLRQYFPLSRPAPGESTTVSAASRFNPEGRRAPPAHHPSTYRRVDSTAATGAQLYGLANGRAAMMLGPCT